MVTSHETDASITFTPLTPVVGAECCGVDISQPVKDETITDINTALAEYGVLLFRDQDITPEQNIVFSRKFGQLDIHVLDQFLLSGHPEII